MANWCKIVEWWANDLKEVTDQDLGCDYNCNKCDECIKMEVGVMRNGKIINWFKTGQEAWNFIEKQKDKDKEKYTVLDWR